MTTHLQAAAYETCFYLAHYIGANCNPSWSPKQLVVGTSCPFFLLLASTVKPGCQNFFRRHFAIHLTLQFLWLPREGWATKSRSSESQQGLPLPSPSSPLQIASISHVDLVYISGPQASADGAQETGPWKPGSETQPDLWHSQIPQDCNK